MANDDVAVSFGASIEKLLVGALPLMVKRSVPLARSRFSCTSCPPAKLAAEIRNRQSAPSSVTPNSKVGDSADEVT